MANKTCFLIKEKNNELLGWPTVLEKRVNTKSIRVLIIIRSYEILS